MKVIHPIPPLYSSKSRVLILGSFPSVKSREEEFFYGHPQNRFWKVLSNILNVPVPVSVNEKRQLILSRRLSLWDVIAQCEIIGSADSTIKNVIPNDLSVILNNSEVNAIFVNGKTAEKYYIKYIEPKLNIRAVCLPSTSPANASYNVEKLCESWKKITEYLKD